VKAVPTFAGMAPEPIAELTSEQERMIRLVLSRFIGEMRGKRTFTYPLGQIAAALMYFELPVVPAGYQALKRLKVTPRELDQRWKLVKARTRELPEETLIAFVPRDLWPGLLWIVEAGPHATWERSEAIFSAWAMGLNEDASSRMVWQRNRYGEPHRIVPGKALSEGSIDIAITALNMLSWHLIELQKLVRASIVDGVPGLEQWTADQLPKRPRAADLDAKPANQERSAPPLPLIRRALRGLDEEVNRRALTTRGRRHSYLFLRDRALLALMTVVGGRRGSTMALNRGDFLRHHTFPDGSVGYAVVLTLGEGVKGAGLRRVKGIPDLVGKWIDEYLEYIGIGDDETDSPLWYPNEMNKIRSRSRWSEDSLDRHLPGVIARYQNDRTRYSAHTLRYLAAQLAEFFGNEWLTAHREDLLLKMTAGLPSSAVTFADTLLDHDLSSVADVYRGLNSERSRETWSRIAALGNWEYLWGPQGARRGPDRERRDAAARTVERAKQYAENVSQRLHELEQRKEQFRRHAIANAGALTGQQLFVKMLELDALSDEIVAATKLLSKAESDVAEAKREHQEALDARIPVDDALPDEEIWTGTDSEVVGEHDDTDGEREILRNWCTPREFRDAFGEGVMPESTLYRWLNGALPYKNGDGRNIFRLDATGRPTVLHVISERKRRILLDELNWNAIHPDVQERLNELRYTTEPRAA